MTLESQYNDFLHTNPDSKFSFNEWKQWHGNQIEQALIKMMQDDEELGLYDYDWCKGNVVLPREEIKLEDVFNDEKKEGLKKSIHKVKSIPKEEILANRSNAYEFIDFDKKEIRYSEEEVIDIAKQAFVLGKDFGLIGTFNEWFEQFKKK